MTNTNLGQTLFAGLAGEFIETLQGENQHKYLGRVLTGDLAKGMDAEFEHQLHAARGSFTNTCIFF